MTAKTLALVTAAVVLMQAAMPPPAVSAVVRVDPPAQADCPGVANLALDHPAFHPDWTTGQYAERLARWHGYLGLVQIPDGSAFRPSESASMVIRAYAPAGGIWPQEDRSIVWREPDGTWWFWRWRIDHGAPTPQPTPPPLLQPGETWTPPPPPTLEERFPPRTGRLATRQAEVMEAAFNDACRAWDPEFYPYDQPFLQPVDGRPSQLCPPDSTFFFAEMSEAGRPRLLYVSACNNDTPTFTLMNGAIYAAGDEPSE